MYPILFKIGHFAVHSYGVLLVIGYSLGLWRAVVAARLHPEDKVPDTDVFDAALWMLVSGIFFARVTFVLLDPNWRQYTLRQAVALWDGGISFDGALFGGLLAVVVYSHVRRLPLLSLVDFLAPGTALGYAIGRVGCFFNGCCYGAPTALPWGVRFKEQGPDGQYVLTAPSHPAQLYSTAMSLLLFGILTWRLGKTRAFRGEVFSWYLMGSATERFIMEFWRAGVTSDYVHGTPLTTAQFFCLFLFVSGVALNITLRRVPAPQTVAAKPKATASIR